LEWWNHSNESQLWQIDDVVFLLSDAFTFSALLIAYGMIRYSHSAYEGIFEDFAFSQEYWPIPEMVFEAVPFLHGIHAPLIFVGIMTFVLILSSVTMVLAVEAGHRMDRRGVEKWMLWTLVGGVAFLGCQAWEWSHFIHGADMSNNVGSNTFMGANLSFNQYGPPNFAALFFFITGFHGFHVFSGVMFNFIVFYQTVTGKLERVGHYEMVEKVGLYWLFCRPCLVSFLHFSTSSNLRY